MVAGTVSLPRMVRLTRMMVLCLHKVSDDACIHTYSSCAHVMPVFILSIGVVRHWLRALRTAHREYMNAVKCLVQGRRE